MKTFRFDYRTSGASLSDDGPVIPVLLTAPTTLVNFLAELDAPPYQTMSGYALIDTGAERSGVDETAMSALQIPSVGSEPFLTTHGVANLKVYNLSASLPDIHPELIELKRAPGGLVDHQPVLGRKIIMLLGRDLLRHFVLTYDGPNATVTLSR